MSEFSRREVSESAFEYLLSELLSAHISADGNQDQVVNEHTRIHLLSPKRQDLNFINCIYLYAYRTMARNLRIWDIKLGSDMSKIFPLTRNL